MTTSPAPATQSEQAADYWLSTITPTLRAAFLAGYKARGIALAEHEAGEEPPPAPRSQPMPTNMPTTKSWPVHDFGMTSDAALPPDLIPADWRQVYHMRGPAPCRGPALFVTRLIEENEGIKTSVIRRLNGQIVQPNDPAFCGTCKQELIAPFSNNDLEWSPVIVKQGTVNIGFQESPQSKEMFEELDNLKNESFPPDSTDPIELPDIPGILDDEQAELRQIAEETGYAKPDSR